MMLTQKQLGLLYYLVTEGMSLPENQRHLEDLIELEKLLTIEIKK